MKKNTRFTKEDFSEEDEINIEYQKAEAQRWKESDAAIGVEVIRSLNCNVDCKICKAGAGKYPKDYEWTIWHPGCKCITIPILADTEDFIKWAESGIEGEDYKFEGCIEDIPEKMKKFMKETGFVHFNHEDYFD